MNARHSISQFYSKCGCISITEEKVQSVREGSLTKTSSKVRSFQGLSFNQIFYRLGQHHGANHRMHKEMLILMDCINRTKLFFDRREVNHCSFLALSDFIKAFFVACDDSLMGTVLVLFQDGKPITY